MHYVTRMYLGQSMPNGEQVQPAAWEAFVSDTVASAFPNGFTMIPADGAWLGSTGFISEGTIILEVYHDGGIPARHAVRNVAVTYRQRFHQDAVMVSTLNLSEGVQFL